MMRHSLNVLLFLVIIGSITTTLPGCKTASVLITPTRAGNEIRFDFATSTVRKDAPIPNSISVYEVENDQRGNEVCELRRLSRSDDTPVRQWHYGQLLAGFERASDCPPLVPLKVYGITVVGSGAAGTADFRLRSDGSIEIEK